MPSNPRSASTSRRTFLRYASLAAAAPILTERHFAFAQQTAPVSTKQADMKPVSQLEQMKKMYLAMPANAVIINANENPLGPCDGARAAIASVAAKGGRYDLLEMVRLMEVFGQQNGVPTEFATVYAGSSEPLHYTMLKFTGPDRPLVAANPTYEAGGRAATIAGAKVISVPLTSTYTHDVKAMAAAHPNPGVIYVCNPNNPTGTITSREDILWLLANKPKGSLLLVDEAYIHLSDAHSVVDQTNDHKDLIVLRTFSKVYGMAGIRAGFAVAHPDTIAKLEQCGENPMPITSSIAARVSLEDKDLIPTRKAYLGKNRQDTIDFLVANKYKVIPGSQSNCFMIDTGRNGRSVINAMAAKNVYIGRTWPIWPNTVRISVGTTEDMASFRKAFKEVMDAPATASFATPATHPHWS